MEAVHAVYRCALDDASRWTGYVAGGEMAVAASAVPQARAELEARMLTELRRWPPRGVAEHAEHALGEGLWVREAMEQRIRERVHTVRVILEALDDQRLRARLAPLPETRAGGLVVLACVPGDTLAWVRDQHDGRGTLIVATAVTSLWWNALTPAGQDDTAELPVTGSLADLGLAEAQATVDDWMAASPCGGLVTLPAPEKAATNPGKFL